MERVTAGKSAHKAAVHTSSEPLFIYIYTYTRARLSRPTIANRARLCKTNGEEEEVLHLLNRSLWTSVL